MIKLDRQSLLQIVVVIALLLGGTYLLHSLGLADLFFDRHQLLRFIDEHRANAVIIFVGLQALQVVAAMIPGEVTGFVGGYLFGIGAGIFYSTIGLTLGSYLAFMTARLLGRHLVEVFVSAALIRKYDYLMRHRGLFLAFLLYLIPGFPKDLLCYLLGLGHMGQVAFLLVSTSGRFLGTVLLTVGGAYFRGGRYVALAVLVASGISFVLLVMLYRKEIERVMRGMRLARHRATRAEHSRNQAAGRELATLRPPTDP
jgi:uncharacterized membrane protein YdjX (TVP38/TMEM64 family)